MIIEKYKTRLGYVARGWYHGIPYRFAGFTYMEAIQKALAFISRRNEMYRRQGVHYKGVIVESGVV